MTPPMVFGCDGVGGGAVVDGGGGSDPGGLQLACGVTLAAGAGNDRLGDDAVEPDSPGVGDAGGGVDGVGVGAAIEP